MNQCAFLQIIFASSWAAAWVFFLAQNRFSLAADLTQPPAIIHFRWRSITASEDIDLRWPLFCSGFKFHHRKLKMAATKDVFRSSVYLIGFRGQVKNTLLLKKISLRFTISFCLFATIEIEIVDVRFTLTQTHIYPIEHA